MRLINRSLAAKLGEETVQILHKGYFKAPSGKIVRIGYELKKAKEGTLGYAPKDDISPAVARFSRTNVRVLNLSTLEAAKMLVTEGHTPLALNFASAKNPGGGFLGGSRAQEEALCLSSGLYYCIKDHEMYQFHRQEIDAMYSDYAIYSPSVPVFRSFEGKLMENSFNCSFITCAAVNVKFVQERHPGRLSEIPSVMHERIRRVLAIAAVQEESTIVLGAWGCGAFRNKPEEISSSFKEVLNEDFRGVFSEIIFAILDSSAEKRFIGPFEKVF